MKKHAGMRQNLKTVRHGARRSTIPEPRQRVAKVLGAALPGLAPIRVLLKEIRRDFMMGRDADGGVFQLNNEEIDWLVVRQEIETRLRAIPRVLPPELEAYQRILEYRATLPRKVVFSEPATHKLRIDVRKLYKAFLRLYDFTADNFAAPWKRAADTFYANAADNLLEYLKTDVEQELPRNWISAVQVVEMFGDKVVFAMANEWADPDEIAEEYRDVLSATFPRRAAAFTKTDVAVAKYLKMKLEDTAPQDIADQYIQDNFPDLVPGSDGYLAAKRGIANTLEHSIRRASERFDAAVEDKT